MIRNTEEHSGGILYLDMNEQKQKPESATDDMYRLVKENNHMLRTMRREAFVGGIIKFVWWILILIVIPYFVYVWYLQPYLEQALSIYQQAQGQAGQVNDAVNQLKESASGLSGIQKFIEQFLPAGSK